MGNLGEVKPINKLVIEMGGDEYVFSGGGGSITPGVPIPEDTVNSAAIIDGAVEMQDLNDSVKAKIQKTYDEDDETLHMDFDEADVNNSSSGGSGEFNNPVEIEEGD